MLCFAWVPSEPQNGLCLCLRPGSCVALEHSPSPCRAAVREALERSFLSTRKWAARSRNPGGIREAGVLVMLGDTGTLGTMVTRGVMMTLKDTATLGDTVMRGNMVIVRDMVPQCCCVPRCHRASPTVFPSITAFPSVSSFLS